MSLLVFLWRFSNVLAAFWVYCSPRVQVLPGCFFIGFFFRFVTPVDVREGWLASDGGCLVLLLFLALCMLDLVLLLPLLTDRLAFASAGVMSLVTLAVLFLVLADVGNLWLAIAVMASLDSNDTESTSGSDSESSSGANTDPWESWDAQSINNQSVTLRRELDVSRSQANRERAFVNLRETFLRQFHLEDARAPSIVNTEEARDLRRWCIEKSWCFCDKYGHLGSQKLLPSF